jgi:hypothetical protein
MQEIDHKKELTMSERLINIDGKEHRFKPPNFDPFKPSLRQPGSGSEDRWGSALAQQRYGGGGGRRGGGARGGYRNGGDRNRRYGSERKFN